MTQATDGWWDLVDEIGRHYAYYFNRTPRPALVTSWSGMSESELTRLCANWRALRRTVETRRAPALVSAMVM